jgi:hypothetical protein
MVWRQALSSGLLSVVLNWNTLHGAFVMDDKVRISLSLSLSLSLCIPGI